MSKKAKAKQVLFAGGCIILLASMSFLCGFTTDTIINNRLDDKFSSIPLIRIVPANDNSVTTH